MSLDIIILGADGPKKQVSIGVDDHYRLMQLVGEDLGSLLARMNDYYADAIVKFAHSELDRLAGEVTALCARCQDDERLLSFLKALLELIESAKLEQQPLLVISD